MPENHTEAGTDESPEKKAPPDAAAELPGGRDPGAERDLRRRIQHDRERVARTGVDSGSPVRASVVDDMKMTEDLERD